MTSYKILKSILFYLINQMGISTNKIMKRKVISLHLTVYESLPWDSNSRFSHPCVNLIDRKQYSSGGNL